MHGCAFVKKLSFGLATALACAAPAWAVPLNGLKGQGLNAIYGSYAPRGDCTAEPRLSIDDSGFTFRANGRVVKSVRVEQALSYLGPDYRGISLVFFPFPVSDDDFGPVVMTVNDGERRGVIRLEADFAPGRRVDPFQVALTRSSPYSRCAAAKR
ncbi:hypothetical protein P7B04_20785 [Sphingobium yanoikuyae]|jgi:hypothetical protein|uniref:hypothetical protein n=1 Tax=Sphingobium yanoikuyae TaxID=13690 RepID=UPI0008467C74|nr:hypothetical protein [Sphingobium yanoikuyae]MDG2515123.1 hypothetical protein [Sphingobium yanoikuyae]RSU70662.1 hypothetical protein BRX37_22550 [Sphingomonas sp. S-NIH.Pt3_0716]